MLARITERLSALENRLRELEDGLSELRGSRKLAAERKSEEKARLESILRRDEFVEKQPEENALKPVLDEDQSKIHVALAR